MDKKLLEKLGLTESQKKFKMLCEYTFITEPISEDDEEGQDDDFNTNGMQGGPQDVQSNNPNDNIEQNQNDLQQNDGQNQNQSDDNLPIQDTNSSVGDAINNIEKNDTDDSNNTEDEVIDVDDLTNSQEDTEKKVDDANEKINQVMSKIDNFLSAIEDNDRKINDLAKEVIKRMPTEDEKLNIRSQSSYPYNIKPSEYWEYKKDTNPNYSIISNNEVSPDKEQEEYVITKDDLNGNDKAIYDTLDDFEDGLTLDKIFNIK